MVESGGLENRYRGNSIESSNLSFSATGKAFQGFYFLSENLFFSILKLVTLKVTIKQLYNKKHIVMFISKGDVNYQDKISGKRSKVSLLNYFA